MRGNYPNCPYCSRPLVDLHELTQRIDSDERQRKEKQDEERKANLGRPGEIERAQQLGDHNPESERLKHEHDRSHQRDTHTLDPNPPEVKRPFETEEARQLHEPHKQIFADQPKRDPSDPDPGPEREAPLEPLEV
jgi:hypothetical protein